MLLQISGLIFTYFISSMITFLAVSRVIEINSGNIIRMFCLTIGMGPLLISWILRWLFYFFPHQPDIFYVSAISVFFLVLYIYSYKNSMLLLQVVRTLKDSFLNTTKHDLVLLLGCVCLFLLVLNLFVKNMIFPIMGNDPLQYATVARLLYENKTISIYPFTVPDADTGFFAVSSHPLGYILLLVWSNIIQGGSSYAGLIKLAAPFFAFYLFVLTFSSLKTKGSVYSFFGVLLLCATPLYYDMVLACHIDPFRIYTFFLAMTWLIESLKSDNFYVVCILGFTIGMSMFSHSIGVLTLPIVLLLYFINKRVSSLKKIRYLALILLFSTLFGGARYISNYVNYNYIVADKLEIWELKQIKQKEYLRQSRGLVTTYDRVVKGILKGFAKTTPFGVSYWISLLGIIYCIVKSLKDRKSLELESLIFGETIIVFYFLVVVSVLLNKDMFIKNDRYILTVQPFVTYFGGLSLGWVNDFKSNS